MRLLRQISVVAVAAAALGTRSCGEACKDELLCDDNAVRRANKEILNPILAELVNTTYFRLFRVQLDGECPTQKNDPVLERQAEPLCGSAPESTSPFFSTPGSRPKKAKALCDVDSTTVDWTLSPREDKTLSIAHDECDDESLPNFWLDLCSKLPFSDASEEYVNLQLNPETFTGYNGSSVWETIYQNNCFQNDELETCYEEQFLYRLLSGLHSSINLHISNSYYPPKKGVRDTWESNIERFKSQFVGHVDRFRNLQYAFVVLLRAAHKAKPVLERLNYQNLDPAEKQRTTALVKMFLDAHLMSSCRDVFGAFDETLLFENKGMEGVSTMSNLKRKFKGVFHNISSTFNCVKCQKCRLHGKMQLLGIGTAIKILLVPEDMIRDRITREEVVALFNTIEKFSESMKIYEELTSQLAKQEVTFSASTANRTAPWAPGREDRLQALGYVADASKRRSISVATEDALVDAILDNEPDVMMLAQEYLARTGQGEAFLRHAMRRLSVIQASGDDAPDAIIVGGGLSGLTAALSVLDRGGRVTLIDKEAVLGGNSGKASSGINGVDLDRAEELGDSVALFQQDVLRGSGVGANPLVDVLVEGSVDALQWFRKRTGLALSHVGQLGGHSVKRTWRPEAGLAGSEMIAAITKTLKETVDALPAGRYKVHKSTKVEKILLGLDGEVQGVQCRDLKSGEMFDVKGSAVVIATGGYANHKAADALLPEIRPDLSKFGTTNGAFATGDGVRLARDIGAATIDLEQVQVHPTAFVDPKNRTHPVKTLAAEIMRGVGAVILNQRGERFVNELGTRKYVSDRMMETSVSEENAAVPEFLMVLSEECAEKVPKHVPMYLKKGLLREFSSIGEIAEHMGVPESTIRHSFSEYDKSAKDPATFPDAYNRTSFPTSGALLDSPKFYAGWIQPAVHYSMGGLKINENAQVLSSKGNNPLGGGRLYAIGESTGGIHGENRLGGNALTECAVFGRHVGLTLPIRSHQDRSHDSGSSTPASATPVKDKKIQMEELAQHGQETDCWVALHGKVYDLTDFIPDHPGAPEAITNICGMDGTKEFEEIHSEAMLFEYDPIGAL